MSVGCAVDSRVEGMPQGHQTNENRLEAAGDAGHDGVSEGGSSWSGIVEMFRQAPLGTELPKLLLLLATLPLT